MQPSSNAPETPTTSQVSPESKRFEPKKPKEFSTVEDPVPSVKTVPSESKTSPKSEKKDKPLSGDEVKSTSSEMESSKTPEVAAVVEPEKKLVSPEPEKKNSSPEPEKKKSVSPELEKKSVLPEPEKKKSVPPEPEKKKSVSPEPEKKKSVSPEPEKKKSVSPEPEKKKSVSPEPEKKTIASPEELEEKTSISPVTEKKKMPHDKPNVFIAVNPTASDIEVRIPLSEKTPSKDEPEILMAPIEGAKSPKEGTSTVRTESRSPRTRKITPGSLAPGIGVPPLTTFPDDETWIHSREGSEDEDDGNKASKKFSRRQWITLIIFGFADLFSAIAISLQGPFYPQEVIDIKLVTIINILRVD